jgi:hypothetical protein
MRQRFHEMGEYAIFHTIYTNSVAVMLGNIVREVESLDGGNIWMMIYDLKRMGKTVLFLENWMLVSKLN